MADRGVVDGCSCGCLGGELIVSLGDAFLAHDPAEMFLARRYGSLACGALHGLGLGRRRAYPGGLAGRSRGVVSGAPRCDGPRYLGPRYLVAGRSEARELLRVLWAPRCVGASASGIDRLVVGLRRVAVVCQDGVVRAALWRGGAAPAG